MNDQREFWNDRFGREGYFYGTNPNAYLASRIDLLKPNQKILFLGEGEGRNAAYAARMGHRVTALDVSEVGLAKARALVHSFGYDMELIHTDLEDWEPECSYDHVLCSFLHLPEPLRTNVFTKVLSILNPGGLFAGEFFSIHQMPRTTGGPKDETLLYTADTLQTIFDQHPVCEIQELRECETELNEGRGHRGIASVVQMTVSKS